MSAWLNVSLTLVYMPWHDSLRTAMWRYERGTPWQVWMPSRLEREWEDLRAIQQTLKVLGCLQEVESALAVCGIWSSSKWSWLRGRSLRNSNAMTRSLWLCCVRRRFDSPAGVLAARIVMQSLL